MMNNFYKNTKLVYWVFEKYFKQFQYLKDDLCQEGLIALWKASSLFDVITQNSFSVYAVRAIKNNMLCYLRQQEIKHRNAITFSELEEGRGLESYACQNDDVDLVLQCSIVSKLNNQTQLNRQILEDYYFSKTTQQQLAVKYNCSVANISKITRKFKKDCIAIK